MAIELGTVMEAVWDLFRAPLEEPSILWQLAPFILLWVAMELYFGTHKKEKLGWNTALSNGITLFWVIISGMQFIFSDQSAEFTWGRFIVLGLLTLYALFVIFVSFKHSLRKKLAFFIASPTPMYYFSIIALLYAYGLIDPTLTMGVAVVVLFIFFGIFFLIVKAFLPNLSKQDAEDGFDAEDDVPKKKKNKREKQDSKDAFSFSEPQDSSSLDFSTDGSFDGADKDAVDELVAKDRFEEKDFKF